MASRRPGPYSRSFRKRYASIATVQHIFRRERERERIKRERIQKERRERRERENELENEEGNKGEE